MIAFLLSLLVPVIIPVGQIDLQPHRIVILLSMPFFLGRLFTGKVGKVTKIDYLGLFGGLWCALAYTLSYPYSSKGGGVMGTAQFAFSFFFELYGGFLIARVGIRNGRDLRRVTLFMFFCTMAALPLAAIEAFTHKAFLMELLGRKPAFDTRFGMRRAQVVFGHPILYGAFVSSAVGLVWYTNRVNAILGGRILRSILIFFALFFSLSMGAILSFMVQSGSIIYENSFKKIEKRWTLLIIGIIAMYFGVDLLTNSNPFSIFVRYMTFNHQASYIRVLTFQYGMDIIYARPFFGFGSARWTRPPGFPSSVDNFWLLTAMQFGLPAFFALATATALIMRRLALKSLSDPLDISCRAAVLTAMGGIVLAGGTLHYWQNMLSFVMFMFGSGIWLLSRPDAPSEDDDAPPDQEAGSEASVKKRFVPYGREA